MSTAMLMLIDDNPSSTQVVIKPIVVATVSYFSVLWFRGGSLHVSLLKQ